MSTDTTTAPDTAAAPASELEVEPEFVNYWGVQETLRFDLPDGRQYFDIKPMDEGAKSRFQKMTNKGIRMNQRSQEAHLDVDPADERHHLILESVVGWRLFQKDPKDERGYSELPCPEDDSRRKRTIRDTILEGFSPKIIQDLEFFIRTSNPWMQADMDIEELYKERDRVDELIKQAKEQAAGEAGSANK